jgi:SAM-dependent methyltransferase
MDDDRIWSAFLEWLPGASPAGHVKAILEQHRAHLAASGLSPEAARERMGTILRLMRERREVWAPLFDRVYAATPQFETAPNAFLARTVAGRDPGDALEVGVGQGRNAVFLAGLGWRVTGVDVSEAGLASTRRNAAAAGVNVRTVHLGDGEFEFPEAAWDLVVLTYVPVPLASPAYAARLARALRPGGLLVVESFASEEGAPGRTPVDQDPAALREAFAGLETLAFEDEVTANDWEEAPVRVVRLAAARPAG